MSSPFLLRDGSGYSVDSAGMVWLARDVPSEDGPHQVEWEDDKQTDTGNGQLQRTLTQNNGAHGMYVGRESPFMCRYMYMYMYMYIVCTCCTCCTYSNPVTCTCIRYVYLETEESVLISEVSGFQML